MRTVRCIRNIRPLRFRTQILGRDVPLVRGFRTTQFQSENSKDPLGLHDILDDLKQKEAEEHKEDANNYTAAEDNDSGAETPENDPLGLYSFLSKTTEQGGSNDRLELYPESKVPETADLKESRTFEIRNAESKSEEDDQVDSLLQSLHLQGKVDENQLESEQPSETQNFKDIVEQERALFDDVLGSLNSSAVDNSNTSQRRIYDNLKRYRLMKDQNKITNQEDKLTRAKQALSPTLQFIDQIKTPVELIDEINKLLLRTTELLHASETSTEIYNGLFLPQLTDQQFDDFIETINQNHSPEKQQLNLITLPILFNEFLKVNNNKFKDGQLTISLFNYLKSQLSLYLLICNQDTYNEILKTVWIFHGKSNLYQIEIIITEMLNNGFQGNLLTFNILKKIILDYYNLKMNNYPFINNNLPIWNQEDDHRVLNLERKLRAISFNIKRAL